MGLLDSVLGAVLNNGQQQAQPQAGLGGLGGIIGMLASNPQLIQVVTGMLSNNGDHGGLGGLVGKFEQAGLGNVVGSWIGGGQNQPISADQLSNVLGSDALSGIAAKLGVDPSEAAGQLAQVLPGLVDHLTPAGQAPQAGLGDSSDLFGMLGGLLQKS
ncbi:MAG: YidB family protein [Rhodoferax sp.]|uniref:YidB family protein n=1 Tax=Rhodoferax sp. TaxID=50421 RepID=UPI0032653685